MSGCATGLSVMSSTVISAPSVKTRTEPMSARPSGDCSTAARPNGAEEEDNCARSISVLCPGGAGPGLDLDRTVPSPKGDADETHIDTFACGCANVTIS